NNMGTGSLQIGVSGNTISYSGAGVATFTGGTDGTALVITFNAAASHDAIEAVMDNVNVYLSGSVPSPADRTVEFQFNDGGGTANGGADTATAHVTVDVSAPPQVHISAPETVAVGIETLVNTTTLGQQGLSSAAVLGNGSYVVAWMGSDGVYF